MSNTSKQQELDKRWENGAIALYEMSDPMTKSVAGLDVQRVRTSFISALRTDAIQSLSVAAIKEQGLLFLLCSFHGIRPVEDQAKSVQRVLLENQAKSKHEFVDQSVYRSIVTSENVDVFGFFNQNLEPVGWNYVKHRSDITRNIPNIYFESGLNFENELDGNQLWNQFIKCNQDVGERALAGLAYLLPDYERDDDSIVAELTPSVPMRNRNGQYSEANVIMLQNPFDPKRPILSFRKKYSDRPFALTKNTNAIKQHIQAIQEILDNTLKSMWISNLYSIYNRVLSKYSVLSFDSDDQLQLRFLKGIEECLTVDQQDKLISETREITARMNNSIPNQSMNVTMIQTQLAKLLLPAIHVKSHIIRARETLQAIQPNAYNGSYNLYFSYEKSKIEEISNHHNDWLDLKILPHKSWYMPDKASQTILYTNKQLLPQTIFQKASGLQMDFNNQQVHEINSIAQDVVQDSLGKSLGAQQKLALIPKSYASSNVLAVQCHLQCCDGINFIDQISPFDPSFGDSIAEPETKNANTYPKIDSSQLSITALNCADLPTYQPKLTDKNELIQFKPESITNNWLLVKNRAVENVTVAENMARFKVNGEAPSAVTLFPSYQHPDYFHHVNGRLVSYVCVSGLYTGTSYYKQSAKNKIYRITL